MTTNQTRLTMKQTLFVGDVLRQHLRRVPNSEPACFEYEFGWDDEKVAAETNVSVKAVVYRRIKGFGPFPPATEVVVATAIADRLDALERRVAALEGIRPGELPLR